MSAAGAIVVAIVGYFIFLSSQVVTGGPMYGAVLIVAGALVGFFGGLMAKL
jgi:hypothetical protein